MRKVVLIIVFLLWNVSNSQNFNTLYDDDRYIDSVSTLIKKTKSDSIRCINSFKLADLYRINSDLKKFAYFLNIGNRSIGNNTYLKVYAEYCNALQYLVDENPDAFIKKVTATSHKLKKFNTKSSYILRGIIAQNLSLIYQVKENEKESVRQLTDVAMPNAKKANDYQLLAGIYELIGIAIMNNSNRIKAQEYFEKAVYYIEKATIPSPFLQECKVEFYIVTAENLMYLNQFSKAKILLDKAKAILQKHPKSNMFSLYYYAESLYHLNQEKYQEALIGCEKGIRNGLQYKDRHAVYRLKFIQYQALYNSNKLWQAKDVMLDLINDDALFIVDKKNCYREIAFVYEELEDYKNAYEYNKKYIDLNDSIEKSQTKEQVIELEAKFNKSENESKIQQLKSQKEKAELLIQNSRLRYAVFAILSVVLIIILIFSLIYFGKKSKLALRKDLINQQKIATLKSQKEIAVMQAMIDGEEIERKRIARELHDGIGSKLSALKIILNRFNPNEIEENKLESVNDLLTSSINELRQISYNLVPESLLKLGLEKALGDLCHMLDSDNIKIEFQSFGINQNMNVSSQLNIYRIVQELINNALKHANCTAILVSCSQNGKAFYISVEDNGTGFSINQVAKKSGLGLINLKSRVEVLNGNLNIESSSTGTYYNIELTV